MSFTAAGLKDGKRSYSEARDPRTGHTAKRVTILARSAFAIVDYNQVNSTGEGFPLRQTDTVAGLMLGPHWTIEPGSSERRSVGDDPLLIRTFMATSDEPQLREGKVACVGIQRFHDRLPWSDGPITLYQAVANVVYCQGRTTPMDVEVARAVASRLVLR